MNLRMLKSDVLTSGSRATGLTIAQLIALKVNLFDTLEVYVSAVIHEISRDVDKGLLLAANDRLRFPAKGEQGAPSLLHLGHLDVVGAPGGYIVFEIGVNCRVAFSGMSPHEKPGLEKSFQRRAGSGSTR